ncbi:ETC complex I subunit [Sphingomonas sp.]|uniref:ETC complex I subunit n=1 Tax=Sphingomonas sp. TaxID=28214 RepID=UPI0033403F89
MSTARIYQRPKNSMSSGRARTSIWVLEFAPAEAKRPDPLTGWAGSGDTNDQVRLTFPTQAAAIAYAEQQGLAFTVIAAPERTLKLQSYADNFR